MILTAQAHPCEYLFPKQSGLKPVCRKKKIVLLLKKFIWFNQWLIYLISIAVFIDFNWIKGNQVSSSDRNLSVVRRHNRHKRFTFSSSLSPKPPDHELDTKHPWVKFVQMKGPALYQGENNEIEKTMALFFLEYSHRELLSQLQQKLAQSILEELGFNFKPKRTIQFLKRR